jgi:hypothetical protein
MVLINLCALGFAALCAFLEVAMWRKTRKMKERNPADPEIRVGLMLMAANAPCLIFWTSWLIACAITGNTGLSP